MVFKGTNMKLVVSNHRDRMPSVINAESNLVL